MEFTKILIPVIQAVWKTEEIPQDWNKGHITSIWKGRGDKECLEKHRGITVSSTIGAIMEEVIDQIVPVNNNFLSTGTFWPIIPD